ncbi:type II restriction endonuclease [uncultured Thalassolituus sp.]|uniref:type II restriction endonuclease n=1 Tax=uncultured Thalassolituus sp. TaxID=285273 RepID=UPI002606C8B3|nr:type II restriction endonuclease [uncultured Thalassolituus sp.]
MFEKVSDVFSAVAFKFSSAVDVDPESSNQHELGGLVQAGLKEVLGSRNDGTQYKYAAEIVHLSDNADPVVSEEEVTWYDVRFQNPNRGPEWRLYYPSCSAVHSASEGDFLLVAVTKTNRLLIIFCDPDSSYKNELVNIFSIEDASGEKFRKIDTFKNQVQLPLNIILSRYGVELGSSESFDVKKLLSTFKGVFPKTKDLSQYARNNSSVVSPVDDPDGSLMHWMSVEESMFRAIEKEIVERKLKAGFNDNVDEFISFSLSVQNRRKSRVGHAFENHIEEILMQNAVLFSRGKKTEGNRKPDFIFPGITQYLDANYPDKKLHMLGAKTTCKDRWRQILPEARRINTKHLITLQPAISKQQIDEMVAENVQLVVPSALHPTYDSSSTVISFKDFINEVKL